MSRYELLVSVMNYAGNNLLTTRHGISREQLEGFTGIDVKKMMEDQLKRQMTEYIMERLKIEDLSQLEKNRMKAGLQYDHRMVHHEQVYQTQAIVFTPKEFVDLLYRIQRDIIQLIDNAENNQSGPPQ